MIIVKAIEEVRSRRRGERSLSWGFVPTMGYLHEGHLELVRRARADNERVVVSIFVNPAQFAPNEDFAAYPRDEARDLALLESEGVDLAFLPEGEMIYPPQFQTTISVTEMTRLLEGFSRPTHFRGVTTVVGKLFNIVQPDRAYFGQKDAQQAVVIKRMVQDLNFDVEIVVCPTVREHDGLAMSSRNARLSPEERQAAPVLYRALLQGKAAIEQGEAGGDRLRSLMAAIVRGEPLARLDYVSVADPHTMRELDIVQGEALLSGAIFIGSVRLIDNLVI